MALSCISRTSGHVMSVEVNGVAHVILTVSDWKKSAPFYRALGQFLGWTCVMDAASDDYSKGDNKQLLPFMLTR